MRENPIAYKKAKQLRWMKYGAITLMFSAPYVVEPIDANIGTGVSTTYIFVAAYGGLFSILWHRDDWYMKAIEIYNTMDK